jgi:hypothetical protein
MSDLLDAIDRLTKPIRSAVVQSNDAGITCKSPIVLPSLLDQLDEAIQSSMGGNSSGASLASQRSLLDESALFEAMKITTQIGDWCRIVEVRPVHQPAADLKAWHLAIIAKPQRDDSWHVRQLHKWASRIEAMLDRPREKDLPDACPACGAEEWWKDGSKYIRPLIIRYKPEDEAKATALCRFCEQTWNARELAFALEEAERNTARNDVA